MRACESGTQSCGGANITVGSALQRQAGLPGSLVLSCHAPPAPPRRSPTAREHHCLQHMAPKGAGTTTKPLLLGSLERDALACTTTQRGTDSGDFWSTWSEGKEGRAIVGKGRMEEGHCVRDLTTGCPDAMPGAARGRHRAPINGQPARGDPGRSDTPAPAFCCGAPADCLGKFCPDGHETWRVHSKRSQKAPPSGTTPAPASKAERHTCCVVTMLCFRCSG